MYQKVNVCLDNCGEMEVVNHKTGDKCYMKFEPYSYFGGTPKKVTGTVNSVDDKVNSFFSFFLGGGLTDLYQGGQEIRYGFSGNGRIWILPGHIFGQ